MEHGITAATNGVVLATERKVPSLLVEEDTMEKVAFITNSIGKFGCFMVVIMA